MRCWRCCDDRTRPALPPPEPHDEPVPDPVPPEPPRRPLLPWLSAAGFVVLAAALFLVWLHPLQPPAPEAEAQARHLPRWTRGSPGWSSGRRRSRRIWRRLPHGWPPSSSARRPRPHRPARRLTWRRWRPAWPSWNSTRVRAPIPAPAPTWCRSKRASRRWRRSSRRTASCPAASTRSRRGPTRSEPRCSAAAVGRSAPPRRRRSAAAQRSTASPARSATLTERTARLGRVQAAQLALDAGQPLGDVPGAPPALTRFANAAPPDRGCAAACLPAGRTGRARRGATASSDDKPLLARVWAADAGPRHGSPRRSRPGRRPGRRRAGTRPRRTGRRRPSRRSCRGRALDGPSGTGDGPLAGRCARRCWTPGLRSPNGPRTR